ncbi:heat shock protein DnaJ, partial [Mytilinidion resinicola]
MSSNPYVILDVAQDADITTIHKAYHRIALRCHPDKIQDPALRKAGEEEFKKVQNAVELLCDDYKRAVLD